LNVHLFQFSVVYPGGVALLPYSAAGLWANAVQHPKISANYRLGQIHFEKRSVEEIVEGLDEPAVCAFSSYVWSEKINHAIAKRVRARFPECLIIFGGPQVPNHDPDMFRHHPWVDVCVHGEGEVPFEQILLANLHDAPQWSEVRGVSFPDPRSGHTIWTDVSDRIDDLSELPSPYLTGLLDPILDVEGFNFAMIMETNRGCPFRCTYCDWGSLTYQKIKRFPLERIRDEFEWAGRNRVEAVHFADANFGIFKGRDEEIADLFIESKQRHGFPQLLSTPWTKNSNDTVMQIATKLHEAGALRSFEISVQTFSPDVLKAVKRDNMDSNKYDEVLAEVRHRGIPHGTELIMGLALETYDSWLNTLDRICQNDTWFHLSPLQVLVNSEYAHPEYMKKYGVVTRSMDAIVDVSEHPIREPVEIVVATDTMPEEDMHAAWSYTWIIYAFHLSGFTNYVAEILEAVGHPRTEFYRNLHVYVSIENTGVLNQEYSTYFEEIRRTFGWQKAAHMFLKCFYSDRSVIDRELLEFLERYYADLPPDLLQELVRFQRFATFDATETYPLTCEFQHDFLSVFSGEKVVLREPTLLEAENDSRHHPDRRTIDEATFQYRKRRTLAWKNRVGYQGGDLRVLGAVSVEGDGVVQESRRRTSS
jgi:2-(S-pantetheinyl)-carbapenam-3-carboxylate methyltransferase